MEQTPPVKILRPFSLIPCGLSHFPQFPPFLPFLASQTSPFSPIPASSPFDGSRGFDVGKIFEVTVACSQVSTHFGRNTNSLMREQTLPPYFGEKFSLMGFPPFFMEHLLQSLYSLDNCVVASTKTDWERQEVLRNSFSISMLQVPSIIIDGTCRCISARVSDRPSGPKLKWPIFDDLLYEKSQELPQTGSDHTLVTASNRASGLKLKWPIFDDF
jgi:hypothetical protein